MAFAQLSTFWLSVIIFVIGIAVPVQTGVNALLGRTIQQPVFAAFLSFLVGAVSLFLAMILGQMPWPTLERLSQTPWWMWIGGAIGATFVLGTLTAIPRLGSTTTLTLILAGQMLAALYFDHNGLLGSPEHPISLMRIVGVLLLFGGVYLIQRF